MPRFLELWIDSLPRMLAALVEVTIPLSLLSFAIALAIAVVMALLRLYAPAPLKLLAWAYVQVFRGTPLVVQLFIVFFGLPTIGIDLGAFTAAVVTLALNSGAYRSEEHTSELQSRGHLVCRLLLEKKEQDID